MNMFLWTWVLEACGAVGLLSPSSGCSECDVQTLVPDYTASLPEFTALKTSNGVYVFVDAF
jgi:hypothetical protein